MADEKVVVLGGTDPEKHWPRVLIFDANVYLNLAKVPGNAPVLRAMADAVKSGTHFRLVVPQPVMTAVTEHRENAIKQHWDIRRSALRSMKDYLADIVGTVTRFEKWSARSKVR